MLPMSIRQFVRLPVTYLCHLFFCNYKPEFLDICFHGSYWFTLSETLHNLLGNHNLKKCTVWHILLSDHY